MIPRSQILSLSLLALVPHPAGAAADVCPPALEACDVVWDSPGKDSADSMPLGNGDIGLNVWTEENGDILFYISKTDAWSETPNGPLGLVKVGRVRLSLDPPLSASGGYFRQTLRLRHGEVEIASGTGESLSTVRIWVDANHPVIRVEATSASPTALRVGLDPWRTTPSDKISADVVLPAEKDRLAWYHRNGPGSVAEVKDLTFGGLARGPGLVADGASALRSSAPSRQHEVAIAIHSATTASPEEWLGGLERASSAAPSAADARAAHLAWWAAFWGRSWIFVSGDEAAEKVTRGYALQRFIAACAGRGAYPIKFNGSIFTVDNPALKTGKDKTTGQDIIVPVTADYRAWGGQYWFQNTRPMYWPRLMAGDYDLMQPLFRMYGAVLEKNTAQVKEFYGHSGSYMAETAPFFGGIPKLSADGPGSYTQHYFTPVLELTAMMLDYYAHTGDEKFAREQLVPMASAGLTFFDRHFGRGPDGKLLLDPDNSIEMYWKVRDPLPDIAGLHWVLDRLLSLPGGIADAATLEQWKRLRSELPEIPAGPRDGKKVLLPFAPGQEAKSHNSENPELYAVYPFRHFGVGKPDLAVAVDTYAARLNKRAGCWHQDPVQAALLGLTDEAKKWVTHNLSNSDRRLRFPAFWDKGHDYEPDQDNGGHGELGLQLMLMQCEGQRILLLPAWPKGWEADFKLHAPGQTAVRGRVKDGKVADLRVTPSDRLKSIEFPPYPTTP